LRPKQQEGVSKDKFQRAYTRDLLQGFVREVAVLRQVEEPHSFQVLDIVHSGIGDEPTADLQRL
jgi:hypothetical protein